MSDQRLLSLSEDQHSVFSDLLHNGEKREDSSYRVHLGDGKGSILCGRVSDLSGKVYQSRVIYSGQSLSCVGCRDRLLDIVEGR